MQRMKQCILVFLSAALCLVLFADCFQVNSTKAATCYFKEEMDETEDYRACWISYIDIETYLKDKTEAAFIAKVNAMYDKIKSAGLNTVIVHTRAMGDAYYISTYFPYSQALSTERICPDYDPYRILVTLAHEKGLRFEAWINPYRISNSDASTDSFMQTPYYEKYQSMLILFTGSNGTCLSLDPCSEDAQTLVCDSIKELLKEYPVDGIHFDDYFFVQGMGENLTTKQKTDAVNTLVKKVYACVKAWDKTLTFGISPAGNPNYARSQGADIDTWLSEDGYVDYVMPQIYWTDHYQTENGEVMMFSDRMRQWETMHTNHAKLYIGLALYRVGETSIQEPDWEQNNDNLASQCSLAYQHGYDGFALFRYANLEDPQTETERKRLLDFLQKKNSILQENTDAYILYASHMQTYGWQSIKKDGVVSGMPHGKKRLEAIRICLGGKVKGGSVLYSVSEADKPDAVWASDGDMAGSVGKSKSIDQIRIKLSGQAETSYDVLYRVYQSDTGWSNWHKNGDFAGDKNLQAFQIKLAKKTE